MKNDTECTLTDKELIEKSFEWIHKLAESGGRKWTLKIPADVNGDPDLLFAELGNRLKKYSPEFILTEGDRSVEELLQPWVNDMGEQLVYYTKAKAVIAALRYQPKDSGQGDCTHEGLIDTGMGTMICQECKGSWTYDQWKRQLNQPSSLPAGEGVDVEALAEAYANKHSYQSDKEQLTVTPWSQWNIYHDSFLSGFSANSSADKDVLEQKLYRLSDNSGKGYTKEHLEQLAYHIKGKTLDGLCKTNGELLLQVRQFIESLQQSK